MNKIAFVLSLIALAASAHLYYIATETEKILYNEKEMGYSTRRTLEKVANCEFKSVATYSDWEVETKVFLCVDNFNS